MSTFDDRRQANKEAARKERAQTTLHLRKLMATPEGVWLLSYIMTAGRVMGRAPFLGNSRDVFHQGRRDLALEVYEMVREHVGPEKLAAILLNPDFTEKENDQ